MSLSKSDVNNDNNSSFSVDDDEVFHEGTTNTTVPSDDSADTPIVDDSLASVDDIKNYYGKDQTSNYSNDSGYLDKYRWYYTGYCNDLHFWY